MNPQMISYDFDVFGTKHTVIETTEGVFFATFDGKETDFFNEDQELLFCVLGNCTDKKVARQFVKVWVLAFNAGMESGRNGKMHEIRLALGL